MKILRYIPLFGVVLLLYNLFASGPGSAEGFSWDKPWKTIDLPSGAELALSYSEGFIIFALIVLFVEIIKSTSASDQAITEQILSVLVFIIFLLQFLNTKQAPEATFLMLTIMSLIDVLAGFVILTKVARRDINFGGN